jgi:hypothetical protein
MHCSRAYGCRSNSQATEEEQKRLTKMFGIERARASENIIKLSEYHSFHTPLERTSARSKEP